MINLATLTGAIIIALGNEYAGLFSNDDKLSDQLYKSGKIDNEKVWRLPLSKEFDKLMNSQIADVQNINYAGGAQSIDCCSISTKICFKRYALGSFRYCWNGMDKKIMTLLHLAQQVMA